MYKIFFIGSGGFIGSILRYLVGIGMQRLFSSQNLPYGTICANVVGCFLIGLLYGLAEGKFVFSESTRAFFFVGLLGGFTTFSTFAFETYDLARNQYLALALANTGIQIIFGLFAVWLGYILARLIP